MITLDVLREFGANVDEGLARCMNNEAFYLRMVDMALKNDGFEKLKTAVEAHDADAAFEYAHMLKGVLANLSLTPILTPVSELTELLRGGNDGDYSELLSEILSKTEQLRSLAG